MKTRFFVALSAGVLSTAGLLTASSAAGAEEKRPTDALMPAPTPPTLLALRPEPTLTAAEILQRIEHAHGGDEASKKAMFFQMSGTAETSGHLVPFRAVSGPLPKFRLDIGTGKMSCVWSMNDTGPGYTNCLPTQPGRLESVKQFGVNGRCWNSAQYDARNLILTARRLQKAGSLDRALTIKGPEIIDGTSFWVLSYTIPGQVEYRWVVDGTTWYIRELQLKAPDDLFVEGDIGGGLAGCILIQRYAQFQKMEQSVLPKVIDVESGGVRTVFRAKTISLAPSVSAAVYSDADLDVLTPPPPPPHAIATLTCKSAFGARGSLGTCFMHSVPAFISEGKRHAYDRYGTWNTSSVETIALRRPWSIRGTNTAPQDVNGWSLEIEVTDDSGRTLCSDSAAVGGSVRCDNR